MNSKFKCTNCKNYFKSDPKQVNNLSKFCSNKCRFEYLKKSKTTEKAVKKLDRQRRKSLSKLKKDLNTIFSKYIRLRDAIKTTGGYEYVKCISCNEIKPTKSVDAGHFISRSHTSLLYNEYNVNAQCKHCNMPPNPGEQYLYSIGLRELYGQDLIDKLYIEKNTIKKYSKYDILEMIDLYEKKFLELANKYGDPWK